LQSEQEYSQSEPKWPNVQAVDMDISASAKMKFWDYEIGVG